jgi:hypothetical protein
MRALTRSSCHLAIAMVSGLIGLNKEKAPQQGRRG